MTIIYIPKDFAVTSNTFGTNSAVHEAVSSDRTYKTLTVTAGGEINTSPDGYICALLYQCALSDSLKSDTSGKYSVYRSNAVSSLAQITGVGNVVHLAPCHAHHLPSLPAEAWDIPYLNQQSVYNNNISGRGEFIGRYVVRKSEQASIKPMSFAMPVARLAEIKTLVEGMQKGLFYVEVDVPDSGTVILCGWTEDAPQIRYTGDMSQVELSFSMRLVV